MDRIVAPCLACKHPCRTRICEYCRSAVYGALNDLPRLYVQLGGLLAPGSSKGDRVSGGSKTPPLPVRVDPLSLRANGGIVTVLGDWESDWRELLGWSPMPFRGTVEQNVSGRISFLRGNWPWAIECHPVPHDFAREILEIRASCQVQIQGPGDSRPIGPCPTVCDDGNPCNTILWADPYVPSIRCRGCGADWPQDRWLALAGAMYV